MAKNRECFQKCEHYKKLGNGSVCRCMNEAEKFVFSKPGIPCSQGREPLPR